MNPVEALRFQTNIENIKEHVRNTLAGHTIVQYLPWDERFHCSGCTSWSYEEDNLQHQPNCLLVKQQISTQLLKEWANV